ncbi:MAG TPA: urate hydroxylase PuuD [Candidatus Sulfotelmatobacter sp.]
MPSATLPALLLDISLANSFAPSIHLPEDFNTNFLMAVRWIHFLAGITWIGLLYFFNLVNVPLMKELDASTKGKVLPALMTRALWWFRMSAALTVLAGLAYWGNIVGADAHNAAALGFANASVGSVMGSFFLIWTIVWALLYAPLIPGKGIFDKGAFIGVIYAVMVAAAAWLFLSINSRGWESNRLLCIGIGGGIGWVMLLNVWGVIWRIQKRLIQWTRENSTAGTAIPDKAKAMARQAFLASRANAVLSVVMLFFMGAASHYPILGK